MRIVIAGAVIGFIVGMLVGGRVAGGKVTAIKPPYLEVEGRRGGFSGCLLQLGIAVVGAAVGAGIALVVTANT